MDTSEHMTRFRTHLSAQGLKFTLQRRAIAEVFFAGDGHLSLTELLERARRAQPGVGYATVYRTMKLLAECGLASEHKFGEGEARYEPAADGEHHDHLLCVACGRIVEFEEPEIEVLQRRMAARHGFEITSHRHEIYGVCAACRGAPPR